MIDGAGEQDGLRRAAEDWLSSRHVDLLTVPAAELPRLAHELQVHQIELEMQNEELRRIQLELEAARDGYAELFDLAPVAYFSLDRKGRILRANLTVADLLGQDRSRLTGKNFSRFTVRESRDILYHHLRHTFQASGLESCELMLMRGDSERFFAQLQSIVRKDGGGHFNHYLTVVSDISERKSYEDQILRQAYYDALTGLPNRVLFMDRVGQAIRTAHREGSSLALMYIDLDHFKWVNDSMGHRAGDQLLKGAAERLHACARASDTVARLSGDEFCMILPKTADPAGAGQVAGKILSALARPFLLGEGNEFRTSASIGITFYPDEATEPETLLNNADVAMYFAKNQGRGSFAFFTREMNHKVRERRTLTQELCRASTEDEFELHYQPILDIASGNAAGVEALLRWRHPQRGLLAPDTFIPVAEESDLIVEVGDWVLRTVIAQAGVWRRQGVLPPRLWVNVSCRQTRDQRFEDRLLLMLEQAGLTGDVQWLGLEITESVILELTGRPMDMFRRINSMGISLSVDDFGTGYSSLTRLQHLPVQVLKMDRSFLHNVTTRRKDANLIRAIIALAHTLDMKIIAEGIETATELEFLRDAACDLGQGYYFSKPLPASQLEDYLRTQHDPKNPTDGALTR